MFRPSRMSAALKKCQEINAQLTEENAVLKAIIEQLNNVHNTELTEEDKATLAAFADEHGIPHGGYRRRTRKHRSKGKKCRGTKRR